MPFGMEVSFLTEIFISLIPKNLSSLMHRQQGINKLRNRKAKIIIN